MTTSSGAATRMPVGVLMMTLCRSCVSGWVNRCRQVHPLEDTNQPISYSAVHTH